MTVCSAPIELEPVGAVLGKMLLSSCEDQSPLAFSDAQVAALLVAWAWAGSVAPHRMVSVSRQGQKRRIASSRVCSAEDAMALCEQRLHARAW